MLTSKHLVGRQIVAVDTKSGHFNRSWTLTLDDGSTVSFRSQYAGPIVEILVPAETCEHKWRTERNTLMQTWECCEDCGTIDGPKVSASAWLDERIKRGES